MTTKLKWLKRHFMNGKTVDQVLRVQTEAIGKIGSDYSRKTFNVQVQGGYVTALVEPVSTDASGRKTTKG